MRTKFSSVTYTCCNCEDDFEEMFHTFYYFAEGGSVFCQKCKEELVPQYDFKYIKCLVDWSSWVFIVGVLLYCMLGFLGMYELSFVGSGFSLLPYILISSYYRILSLEENKFPVLTRKKTKESRGE